MGILCFFLYLRHIRRSDQSLTRLKRVLYLVNTGGFVSFWVKWTKFGLFNFLVDWD